MSVRDGQRAGMAVGDQTDDRDRVHVCASGEVTLTRPAAELHNTDQMSASYL